MLFVHFLFLFFIISLFIIFYFSFFLSDVRDEVSIDLDYLLSSSIVESEKEITAFDDIILTIVILCYVFG